MNKSKGKSRILCNGGGDEGCVREENINNIVILRVEMKRLKRRNV